MPLVITDVKESQHYFAHCKKCDTVCEFAVIEATSSLVLKILKYHLNFCAVCLNCNTVYNIPEKVGKDLICGKGTLILGDIKKERLSEV